MKSALALGLLAVAFSVLALAADEQTISVTSASIAKNQLVVKAKLRRKAITLWCSDGPFCTEPAPGEYSMVRAETADDAIYQDCTDVVLYKSSGAAKEKVGVYCWLDPGDCYMGCGFPTNVESWTLPMPRAVALPTAEPVWEWFQKCKSSRAMRIELLINRRVTYRSSFPVCRIARDAEPPQKRIQFSFAGGQLFQGKYHTTKAETIEGNFWLAGTERNLLLLGISFTTENQVLLNTIHAVRVDRASTSEIESRDHSQDVSLT